MLNKRNDICDYCEMTAYFDCTIINLKPEDCHYYAAQSKIKQLQKTLRFTHQMVSNIKEDTRNIIRILTQQNK